jgi:hypothetical protein
MDALSKIKQSIRKIAGGTGIMPAPVFLVKIKEIDGAKCTAMLDDLELKDVRLRATINNSEQQILIIPKKDSYVCVADLSEGNLTDLVVVGCSEVEETLLKIENQTLKINKDGFVFNGGDKGLVKIDELHNRLLNLESKFNNHVHSGVIIAVAGGSGAPATGTAGNSGTPTSTSSEFQGDYTGYENDKILTH